MSDVSGYDSVASTAAEWRQIVPEPATFKGVIGVYGNGKYANRTAGHDAFTEAIIVVYDVNGSQPEDDLVDDEPGDANDATAIRWVGAYKRLKIKRTLTNAGLYKSASGVARLVSNLLDAGYKRTDFLIQSAHYWINAQGEFIEHLCGPDTCGLCPLVDSTQYADKGVNGQNTDRTVWAAHCFQGPAPDPDARYGLFDNVKRIIIQGHTERETVIQYDVWRAMQTLTTHPHRLGLAVRRARLRILAGRLERVMASEKNPTANQTWRLRELQDRASGMRLV